jgi:hypothetical protein
MKPRARQKSHAKVVQFDAKSLQKRWRRTPTIAILS